MLGWEIVRTCLAKTLDEGTTGMKKNTMASCVLNGTNLFPTSFERKAEAKKSRRKLEVGMNGRTWKAYDILPKHGRKIIQYWF